MSISLDDLVDSLNASHIGQDASDLAVLQAQLAQSLFPASKPRQVRRNSVCAQPCNTPTARTPSSSFSSWGQLAASSHWQDSAPLSSSRSAVDDMEEDERMVEELLLPSSPNHFAFTYSAGPSSPISISSSHSNHTTSSPNSTPAFYPAPEPTPSLFTSTDPFYIAQAQADTFHTPQLQSIFAQAGRPAQSSPFLLKQQQQQQQYAQAQQQYEYAPLYPNNPLQDTHAMFTRTAEAAF